MDTRALVSRYEHLIRLCRFNIGACTQVNHPVRGHESWQPISSYPSEEYRRWSKGMVLVEVTVIHGVPGIVEMTTHSAEFVPWAFPLRRCGRCVIAA